MGTVSRLVGGVATIVLAVATWGPTLWDLAAAVIGLPLLSAGAGALIVRGTRRPGWPETVAFLALVLGSATALTYVSPVDGTAIWIFLGGSMLLAAAKGYSTCEVTTFAEAVTGRRYRMPCVLYRPIDALENEMRT